MSRIFRLSSSLTRFPFASMLGTTTTISGDSSRLVNYDDSVNTSVRYTVIDRSTGLNATFRMNSVETGTTFLTELGWTS